MLSMSRDYVEGKVNEISSDLKRLSKEFQRPLAELNIKKTNKTVLHLIEKMHQLDDMVHEPSYEHNCLMDYWTLKSLNSCVVELREISELLTDGALNEKTFPALFAKIEEASYLWDDNYAQDLSRWSEKLSGLSHDFDEVQEFAEAFQENHHSFAPVFARAAKPVKDYIPAPVKQQSEEPGIDALEVSKPGMRLR